jgi:hypothetical protein
MLNLDPKICGKIAVGKNFLFIEIKTSAQIDDIFVNLQEGL